MLTLPWQLLCARRKLRASDWQPGGTLTNRARNRQEAAQTGSTLASKRGENRGELAWEFKQGLRVSGAIKLKGPLGQHPTVHAQKHSSEQEGLNSLRAGEEGSLVS